MFDDNQRMKLWRYPCCCQQLDHFAETKWRWMSSVHIHSGSQILISWSGHASNYQVIKAMCSQLVDHDSPGFAFPTFITTLWLIKKTLISSILRQSFWCMLVACHMWCPKAFFLVPWISLCTAQRSGWSSPWTEDVWNLFSMRFVRGFKKTFLWSGVSFDEIRLRFSPSRFEVTLTHMWCAKAACCRVLCSTRHTF